MQLLLRVCVHGLTINYPVCVSALMCAIPYVHVSVHYVFVHSVAPVCTADDLWYCVWVFVFLIISRASPFYRKVASTATPPLSWRR